jgi:flavin reductase (DIM6/NTAB) family NADH-FMN oxidoreductase RutF
MRRVPAAVAVVTVEVDGRRLGLTVASLVPLSLEPPLAGFAIRRDAALHELLRESKELAISVLADGQDHLAQHFARGVPPIAMWVGIEVREDDPRLLAGAAGWLLATTVDQVAVGDHSLFVGAVDRLEEGRAPGSLVYLHSGYQAL